MSRTGVTKSHLRKFRNPIQLSHIIFLFPNILRNITQVTKVVTQGCIFCTILCLGSQTINWIGLNLDALLGLNADVIIVIYFHKMNNVVVNHWQNPLKIRENLRKDTDNFWCKWQVLHREWKKGDTILLSISLLIIDRFSQFFHRHTQ